MTQQDLLDRLEVELRALQAEIRAQFTNLDPDTLQWRPDPAQWNILECFAHLNKFSEDYLPPVQRAIHQAKARRWTPGDPVRYTARGKRLIRRTDPGNGKTYKTPKRYNFSHQPLGQEVVKSLIIQCEQLLRTIEFARDVDVNRASIPKPHAWFGRYTLGNVLEFLVLHTRRHILQAASRIPKH